MPRNTSRPTVSPTTLKTFAKSMLAISLSIAGISHANAYDSVTFFGDSLTDGGYFSSITQGNLGLTESGQFTTNPDNTWATSFAEQLGTTSVPIVYLGNQTGNNYAIGGARAGEEVINTDFGFPVDIASAKTQTNNYLANNKVDPNGLYVVWAGANDLLAAADPINNAQATILGAVASQTETINALKDNGANYILVPNIPDIGLTPRIIAAQKVADAAVKKAIEDGENADFIANIPNQTIQAQSTGATSLYNQFMLSGVAGTGANIIPLDMFSLTQEIIASPAQYGFTNVTDEACGDNNSSLTCGPDTLVEANANETYFFADGIHPTGATHQLIADYANAVVTAPSLIGVLPHIATTTGLATNERLQSHVNQIQSSEQKPARTLWAVGEVANQEIAGFDGDNNTQVLLGVDFAHPNSANAVTGLYGNITQKDFENSDVGTGLSDIDLGEVGFGVYHSNKFGGLQINGAAGFGNMDVDVTRAVTLGSNQQQFKSNADGKRFYANLQAGYPMQVSNIAVTPYIGATASRVKIDGLKEKEMSGIAMQFDEQKYSTTYGKLGLKANHSLMENLNLFGDIHYQKQLSDNREAVTARLNTLPNISFETPMVETDDDNVAMTLGLSRSFGLLNANVGVTHSQGNDDDSTSLFIGLNGAF
ncbi:autotransporter domain-containing protein [Psychrobacter sp. Ps1]|uniref:autotransporter domain-containing protein n=1 Tax=Psychrobacter sp. Ps1 TaxID=2790955 RepID=UPI001EE111EA|nr:autotransporter domain-containing protein [Psychrobacter sp. Ps1]MCG3843259.1 autotransporter domain-containing protein [Psychrobacter sp. Ps1]